MPATTFVRNRADVRPAIERVGGAPVVIKLIEGTQGIGVILAPEVKVAESIIETLHSTKQNVLLQHFVSESRGRDIRALVVGDRVVAAMRRTAEWLKEQGATIELKIEDENLEHGALMLNPRNAQRLLDLFFAPRRNLDPDEIAEYEFR